MSLSGGQRQRLALARALVSRPSILILDEATSALDAETELLIRKTLNQLSERLTIIIVAHRMSTIEMADKIYVMDEGEIIEEGSYTELSQNLKSIFRNRFLHPLNDKLEIEPTGKL
jgi:ABC-type multidrug transport system fused ATPase/permease subunit